MTGKAWKLIVLCTLMTGCAANGDLSREMATWQNQPVSVVLDAWGAPDRQEPIGEEMLLTWTDRSPVMYGFAESAMTSMVVCERMLAVTDAGTVSGWRWRGDRCDDVPASTRARGLSAASHSMTP